MKRMLGTVSAVCIGMALSASNPTAVRADIQMFQGIDFGYLLVEPFGGTITLTQDGAMIPNGPGVNPTSQVSPLEARFRLSGPPNTAFTVRVEPATVTLSGGGSTLHLADISSSIPGFSGKFDSTGQAELRIGGRLDIPAGARPGSYAGQVHLILDAPAASGGIQSMPFNLRAVLRAPLHLMNTGPLDFGSLIPGSGTGGFEVLASGGYRAHGGGPGLFRGRVRPATFRLEGPSAVAYTILLPQSIWLTGAGQRIEVRDFTCSLPVNGLTPPGGLDFGVGASLRVDANQNPGPYSGFFMVSVNYQ